MPDSKAKYLKLILINPILNEELWWRSVFKKYDEVEDPKKQYILQTWWIQWDLR